MRVRGGLYTSMWRTRPFIRVLLTILSAAGLLLVLNPSPPLPFLDLVNTIGDYVPNLPGTLVPDLTSVRVAVFEQNAFHDEVIGAVLTVLTDLKTNVTLYRGGLNNGYGEVISDVWDVKEQKPTPIDKLATHIDEGRFDVLVLVSCDAKFMHHHQALRKSFAARQDLHVICLLHEVENFVKENEEQRGMMAVPGEQGRLTFVELSEHGASKVRAVVEGWSTNADQWEVDVVDFAPIFPLTGIPMKTDLSIPSRAAILGRMNPHSRAYNRIISELHESLLSTPEIWGYRLETVSPKLSAEGTQSSPSGIARPRFTPLDDPANPPFTLHLIGNDEGRLSIPEELLESEAGADPIVAIHSEGKYVEFYSDIAAMDLVLPAFVEYMYTEYRASAAIPAAIVCRALVLATPDVLAAYPYLSDVSAMSQPPSLSEIQTIALLRQGQDPHSAATAPARSKGKGRNSANGYFRPRHWEAYERELRGRNAEVWASILLRDRR